MATSTFLCVEYSGPFMKQPPFVFWSRPAASDIERRLMVSGSGGSGREKRMSNNIRF